MHSLQKELVMKYETTLLQLLFRAPDYVNVFGYGLIGHFLLAS